MNIRNRMGEIEEKSFRHHTYIPINTQSRFHRSISRIDCKSRHPSFPDSTINEGNAFRPHLLLLSELYAFFLLPKPYAKNEQPSLSSSLLDRIPSTHATMNLSSLVFVWRVDSALILHYHIYYLSRLWESSVLMTIWISANWPIGELEE